MEGFSQVWPVGDEFYNNLAKGDKSLGRTQDTRERRLCISWIVRACSDYRFSPQTSAVAVKIYETFLHWCRNRPGVSSLSFKQLIVQVAASVLDISKHKDSQVCELMCIVCIALAAKKVEAQEKAPFLGDFDENFTFQELRSTELLILRALSWNLCLSTPLDFVHYWLDRTPSDSGVDCNKTKLLCQEAIVKCIAEIEFASPKTASMFGSAAMVWAYKAQRLPTEELYKDMMSKMGADDGDELLFTVDQIAGHLRGKYPHTVEESPRTESPANILSVANFFGGEKCDALLTGVKRPSPMKRPTPERFLPAVDPAPQFPPSPEIKPIEKKPKCNSMAVVFLSDVDPPPEISELMTLG